MRARADAGVRSMTGMKAAPFDTRSSDPSNPHMDAATFERLGDATLRWITNYLDRAETRCPVVCDLPDAGRAEGTRGGDPLGVTRTCRRTSLRHFVYHR